MKLNYLLTGGFLVIALLVGFVGFTSYNGVRGIDVIFDRLVEDTTPAMMTLGELRSGMFSLLLHTNEYILDPSKEHLKGCEESNEFITNALRTYEKAESEDNEGEVIEGFKQGMDNLQGLAQEIIVLRDNAESQEVVLNKIKELDDLADEMSKEIDAEIEHDNRDLIESQSDVMKTIERSNNLNIAVASGSLILAIALGLIISGLISKPISNISEAVDEITKGNFKVELDKKVGIISEVNTLQDSMNRIIATMKLAVLREKEAREPNNPRE